MIKYSIIVCLILITIPVNLFAYNLIVVSKSGNDLTGNGSEANPYLTITNAYQMAAGGDTILVKPGEYLETITLTKNRLVLKGISADSVIVNYISSSANTINIYGDSILLENILVKGAGHAINIGGHYNTVKNNIILNTSNFTGILVTEDADSAFIYGNRFLQTTFYDGFSCIFVNPGGNVVIKNNTFIGDKEGMAVSNVLGGTIIKNNIIVNFLTALRGNDSTKVLYNNTFNNINNYVSFIPSPGTGEIHLDPQLIGRFQLKNTSPCRGAGENGQDMGAVPFDSLAQPDYKLSDYSLSFKGRNEEGYYRGEIVGYISEKSFTIKNISNANLIIKNIISSNDSIFKITKPFLFPQTINAGDSLEITVSFSPHEVKTFSNPYDEKLSFDTSDPVTPQFDVYLFGLARKVIDAVKVDSLYFYRYTKLGDTSLTSMPFKVKKPQDSMVVDTLHFKNGSSFKVYYHFNYPYVIPLSDSSITVDILFQPQISGRVYDTLVVVSDTTHYIPIVGFSGTNTYLWTQRNPMPTPRFGMASGVINNKIHVVGSDEGAYTAHEIFDVSINQWSDATHLPEPKSSLAAAVLGDTLYAIGGYHYSTGPQRTVYAYSPSPNNWVAKALLPTGINSAGACAFNGKIYVIGGSDGGYNSFSSVYEYNSSSNSWTTKTNMPTPREGLAIAVCNGKIFAFGGLRGGVGKLSAVEIYDPVADSWTIARPMLFKRWFLSAVTLNDKIYLIGNEGGSASVEEYDPVTQNSILIPDIPTKRNGSVSEVVGGKLYVIGGSTSGSVWDLNGIVDELTILSGQNGGSSQVDSLLISIPDTLLAGPNNFLVDTISIPIYVNSIQYNNHNGIYSFQTEIVYNDSLFQCIGYDSSGTVLSNCGGLTDFTVQFRKDSGRGTSLDTLRIAGASDDSLYYPEVSGTPFAFPRPLIKLKFRIPTTAHNGDSTILHFTRFMFNEGIPVSSTNDGSIRLKLRKKGDVDKNGIIQPYDAVLVLRYVIHDTTLDVESQQAAEVSGNVEITAYDASLILQYYVGKFTIFPTGTYYKQALPFNKGADIVMEWGEVKDGIISLLVKAKNLAEVYGYSLALSYDPSVLTYQGYQSSDLTKRMTAVVRNENGQLRMAVAGVDPLDGEREIAAFKFKLNSTSELSRDKLVNLNELVLNEEVLISNTQIASLPNTYSLEQNYPNPFNPETRIRYQILETRNVQLIVYNLLGQSVRTLVNESKPAGVYEVRWDGKNDQGISLASGVYIYRIKAGNFLSTRKLILMK